MITEAEILARLNGRIENFGSDSDDPDNRETEAIEFGANAFIPALMTAIEALELISKNKTDDCDIYTLGCDCDEESITALAKIRKQLGLEGKDE